MKHRESKRITLSYFSLIFVASTLFLAGNVANASILSPPHHVHMNLTVDNTTGEPLRFYPSSNSGCAKIGTINVPVGRSVTTISMSVKGNCSPKKLLERVYQYVILPANSFDKMGKFEIRSDALIKCTLTSKKKFGHKIKKFSIGVAQPDIDSRYPYTHTGYNCNGNNFVVKLIKNPNAIEAQRAS